MAWARTQAKASRQTETTMTALRRLAIGALVLALTGCDQFADGVGSAPPAPPRPEAPPPERSAESLELEAYFQRVERGLLTRGLLRADGGGIDAPFNARNLAENFTALAFFQEYSAVGNRLVQQQGTSILHRWDGPIRIEPVFGETVDRDQVIRDRAAIETFAARLSRVTGHPVRTVGRSGNFQVAVLHEQDRETLGPRLRDWLPEIQSAEVRAIEDLARDTYCVVVSSDPGNSGVITRAVAIIRAELPMALRLSCIHEEIAQGLGLANDSAAARPSIFNDDDEYGRLTTMDELMLGMLYDPRLTPGMIEPEARETVREMAEALLAPAS